MITNKEVLEQGKLVQNYPIDQNPFTGEQESNGGVENFLIYDNKVYTVLTDFTGSIVGANDAASILTDDVDGFIETMFFFDEDDLEAALDAEAEDIIREYDDLRRSEEDAEDWLRNDDW
jgi:hypothetical protein